MRFGASVYVEGIGNIFAVDEAEGKMGWNIEVSEDGTAGCFADVMGILYGVFLGLLVDNCRVFELRFHVCMWWGYGRGYESLAGYLQTATDLFRVADSCLSSLKSVLVLSTLLGDHTSPPASSPTNLNTSSTTSSSLYTTCSSLGSSTSNLPISTSNSGKPWTIFSIPSTSSNLPSTSVKLISAPSPHSS